VVTPAASGRSAGPITGSLAPVATTSALTVPAGTVTEASPGLDRSVSTGVPPARTSTAGAAAVCRTVRRACPAGTAEVSLTKGVSTGAPSAPRCATTVMSAPAGTVTSSALTAGVPDASPPAGKTARSYSPAGSCCGSVRVPGVNPGMSTSPLAYTSTVRPGTACSTDTVADGDEEAAAAGPAVRTRGTRPTRAAAESLRTVFLRVLSRVVQVAVAASTPLPRRAPPRMHLRATTSG